MEAGAEMARRSRGTRLEGLVTHSEVGSQTPVDPVRERRGEIGAVPSDPTVISQESNRKSAPGRGVRRTRQDRTNAPYGAIERPSQDPNIVRGRVATLSSRHRVWMLGS